MAAETKVTVTSIPCAGNGCCCKPAPYCNLNSENKSINRRAEGDQRSKKDQEANNIQNDITPFFQFYSIDAERLDGYNDGALWPVHLGELYRERYRIMLKIGCGSYSTVWLAVDLLNHGAHVALKFLVAREENELRLHRYLRSIPYNMDGQPEPVDYHNSEGDHLVKRNLGPNYAGHRYVIPLLDFFRIGKEREYTILATPVLIPVLQLNEKQKLQLDMKALLFQLLQGMSYLHWCGITHGDLHPGNVALQVPIHQQGIDILHLHGEPRIIPVVPDECSANCSFSYYPKYLVSSALFAHYVQKELRPENALSLAEMRIIDLTYMERPSSLPLTHRQVRGPEFAANMVTGGVLDLGGYPSDVWSTACTMFALVFGHERELFQNTRSGAKNFLWEVERKIGPLPNIWQLPTLETPQLYSTFCIDEMLTPDIFWEEQVEGYQGPWSREEVRRFVGLIRRMMRVDPALRPSIDSILMDEWFNDVRGEKKPGVGGMDDCTV